jgi:hypothetical protein
METFLNYSIQILSIIENFDNLVNEMLLIIKHAMFKQFIGHVLHNRHILGLETVSIKAMLPTSNSSFSYQKKPNNNFNNNKLGKIFIQI